MNKTYGYCRVSSREQNLDRQTKALVKYGVDERDIITDKASGKDFNRQGYITLKEQLLREGDTLVIKELDRLGRDMEMIKEEWHDLISKGINIIVIDTPMLNTTNKTDLEKNLISNIVFELLAYMAEKEREKIKQRQREGIATAKNKGVKFGRPSIEIDDNFKNIYKQWKDGKIKAVEAMELTGLTKATFYRKVKELEGR
ncbi:resolvase [Clostridium novyi A str. BKT29909]|uniref:recombinase family protein n=1 Tax=Clostridium novyi TaxID=1542 RepID=UPI0004DACD4B|nr:recombinase family protein [Clostridium novyi]KEH87230.1 resolvase [Clostridium novyi A str. BKT29909]